MIVLYDKNAIICQDFNNPSLNWSTLTADREGTRLLELTEEAFLYQIVQTPNRGNNIFDLIFTNDSDIIHTCDVSEPMGNIVRMELNLQIITKEDMLFAPSKFCEHRKGNAISQLESVL